MLLMLLRTSASSSSKYFRFCAVQGSEGGCTCTVGCSCSISAISLEERLAFFGSAGLCDIRVVPIRRRWRRSEEHTSELQSRSDIVCRLLLEKKKKHIKWNSGSGRCH